MSVIVNYCLYQLGWFACVFGAAAGSPWIGAAIAVGLVLVHLWLSGEVARQSALIGLAGVIGVGVDSLQVWWGVIHFPHGSLLPWLAPLWVGVLWMQFATILPYGLHWLSGRYGLSAALGSAGGPLAYLTGDQAGAIVMLEPRYQHLAIMASVWAVSLPVIVWGADRLRLATVLGRRYRIPGRQR